MKKFYTILFALVILCATVFPLTACSNTTKGGSAKGASDIEITDPVFGFVKEEEYDPETFSMETAVKWEKLDVDQTYFLFLTFDVKARRDNDGQSLLNVNITFDALNIMNGTIEDVSTGMVNEMTFTDASTGNIGKKTTVSFKIPSLSAEPKSIKMIVSLQPVQVGQSHILIGYDYDEEGYNLLGSDGYTKNLQVDYVQIAAPELSVNTVNGILIWKHVKNADYYCIYENGEIFKNYFTNEVIYIENTINAQVGGEISFNIGRYLDSGSYHEFQIRAFSNNPNILASNSSNVVRHTW